MGTQPEPQGNTNANNIRGREPQPNVGTVAKSGSNFFCRCLLLMVCCVRGVEQTRGQRQTGRNDLPDRVRELLNGW